MAGEEQASELLGSTSSSRSSRKAALWPVVLSLVFAAACGSSESGPPAPTASEPARSPQVVSPVQPVEPHVAWETMTEADKIGKLIGATRRSDATFIRNGRTTNAADTADHLEFKLAVAGDRIETVDQFIEEIASGSAMTGEPYRARRRGGEVVLAKVWFEERIHQIEREARHGDGNPTLANANVQGQGPTGEPKQARQLNIEDALFIIERSELEFLAPQRKAKPKIYTGPEFARLLRTKWRWLGADIHDLDGFLAEIAGKAFSSFKPYRVRHPDGQELELRAWLDERLAEQRAAQ